MSNNHDIIWLDKADSTNSEARRRVSDLDNLSVISAIEQTAGRGQRGNSWASERGENLTFSILMKFSDKLPHQIQAYDQFAISQMNALAILDFLSSYGIEAKIKWPNDIYVGNRKICGTLIENSISGQWLSWSIIGNGINVNQTAFPENLPNPTSMSLETGRRFDNRKLLEEFISIFDSYRNRYLHLNGGLGKLRKLYLSQMWRLGEETSFVDLTVCPGDSYDKPVNILMPGDATEGRVFRGTAKGISDTGSLIVTDATGAAREFGFKEIAWII